MTAGSAARGDLPFTEKGFYLREFRGRTLALAACPGCPLGGAGVREVLKQLAENGTHVVVLSSDPAALAALGSAPPLPLDRVGLEGRIWRALQRDAHAAVLMPSDRIFEAVHELALRLGFRKLVWLDQRGGLARADGTRRSFVDLADLTELSSDAERVPLLSQIREALVQGMAAINLCAPEVLAEELFTYEGSGTLFTPRGYVEVRRLGIDDFGAALALVTRGEEEGFLSPRSADERDAVLADAFGGFVEGRHLAGIGALLRHGQVGEIASLYTLTRFMGEGIGGHLVRGLCAEALRRGDRCVFACTTTPRVVSFFERQGFTRVSADRLPAEKWSRYDPARRQRVVCLWRELADPA